MIPSGNLTVKIGNDWLAGSSLEPICKTLFPNLSGASSTTFDFPVVPVVIGYSLPKGSFAKSRRSAVPS